MDVGGDDSLLCRTGGFFRGARDAFGPQDRFGFFEVTAALDESALAIHESCIRLFTELLDEFWVDFSCCVHKSLELLKRERVKPLKRASVRPIRLPFPPVRGCGPRCWPKQSHRPVFAKSPGSRGLHRRSPQSDNRRVRDQRWYPRWRPPGCRGGALH